MIKILNRYIFIQLAKATFFITVVLTAALWLTQSLRFVDVVISRGFSLTLFFKMIFFLLPDLVSIVLPISTLIAVLFTYNRFLIESELVVMRTSGMSNLALTFPAFSFSIVVVAILYAINLYFLPLSFQKFKDMEYEIRNNLTSYLVQPGEFTTFKGITVYVRERRRSGALRGILLHDARNREEPFTLIAQQGLINENFNGLSITLLNGNRQQVDKTGKPNILFFKSYTLDLSLAQEQRVERKRKPYELFLNDLLNPDLVVETPTMVRKLYAEAHQRLVIPLTVFCFIGIAMAVFLKGDYTRRGQGKRIAYAISLCGALEILLITLINLSERFSFTIPIAYGVIVFCLGGALIRISENFSLFPLQSKRRV
jgi:lipopolysaccharide export system permease protein